MKIDIYFAYKVQSSERYCAHINNSMYYLPFNFNPVFYMEFDYCAWLPLAKDAERGKLFAVKIEGTHKYLSKDRFLVTIDYLNYPELFI